MMEQGSALTGPHVLWFITQLKGLAGAIDHVHHFKTPSASNPQPKGTTHIGRHNDLKPENILVFERKENGYATFKVTDFGHSVFHTPTKDRSRQDPIGDGTESYRPPEDKTSRPADMWALGCIFLKLVLWQLNLYEDEDSHGFTTQLFEYPGKEPNINLATFWYEELNQSGRSYEPPKYHLKPAVKKVILKLKTEHCRGMRAFQGIIGVIEGLLNVIVEKRYGSVELLDKLKSILEQANHDLHPQDGKPHFYSQKAKENRGGTQFSEELSDTDIDANIVSRPRSPNQSPSRSDIEEQALLSGMAHNDDVSAQRGSPGETGGLGQELDTLK
jgi:serine/threonine protein kinase